MHLIPASWSHLHILVSVFPSVGLVFLLGFYITSMVSKNEVLQRTCLVFFGLLALLAIPTYFSGDGSMTLLAQNPKISQDQMDSHYAWAMAGLAMLVITGIAAVTVLWKSQGARLSNNALHLVLGCAVITMALMIVVGEAGWEISHHELQIVSVAHGQFSASDIGGGAGTPQTWSHVHIILNHFPTVGFTFTIAFFILALFWDNVVMKRTALVAFVICAILGVPTYVTGAAAMWALTDPPIAGITKAAINAHRDFALLTLFGLAFTGVTAWIQVWRFRHIGRFSNGALYLVLVFAIITFGIMAETGHRGGQINHPEIRIATDVLITDPNYYWTPRIELTINNVIWFVPWQTVHFFGYTLVFATVLAVWLRILGVWKSIPFSAVHRLLPLGVFGVVMNVFTGMLMLMADTFRYVNETTFAPKMFLLPIGAIAVLYFSLSDKLWAVKAGEDAPMAAKWVAVLTLLAWTGVIMGGRLLPYL